MVGKDNFTIAEFEYVEGKKFSAGHDFNIPGRYFSGGRLSLLEDLSAGRSVLHIGCADHPPLIANKLKSNTWLHARLESVAENVVGVDISPYGIQEAMRYAKSKLVCADIVRDWPEELENQMFEVAILGEILEHVDNPVEFLSKLKVSAKGRVGKLIITVPNAWSLLNLRKLFRRKECINTDHRYWFTAFTLAKVLSVAGLRCDRISFVEPFRLKNPLIGFFYKFFPFMAETIVVEASL